MRFLERFGPNASVGAGKASFHWPAFLWHRRSTVGVELGAGALKLVHVGWGRRGPRLENYAIVPVTGRIMTEGVVVNAEAAAARLSPAVQELRLAQKAATIAVGGPSILTRILQMPRVPETELRAAMRYEAPHHLPLPEQELVYDCAELPKVTDLEEGQTALFLAGCSRQVVNGFAQAVAGAGLRPTAVEPDSLAALRALWVLGLAPMDNEAPMLLLSIGEAETRVSIMRSGVPLLSRSIPTGISHLRALVMDSLAMPADEAEQSLRHEGIGGALAAVTEPWVTPLLEAVERSVEFFLIQNRGQALDRVVLVGGGALLPGLEGALSERMKLRLERAALAGLEVNPSLRPGVDRVAPLLVAALGAALREGVPG